MYASIGGLKTHMQKLSVIGNNVANVNTAGYKRQRALFRDSMYTYYSSGTNGTTTIGSKNPSQIGYGSSVGSIDLDMSSSTYNPGNPTDCALDGDGFFLVGDKTIAAVIDPTNPNSFKSLSLTRVGDFYFGSDGYLVDGTGQTVYGFMAVGVDAKGEPVVSDQLVPIRKPRMELTYTNMDGEPIEVNDDTGEPEGIEGVDWKKGYEIRFPVVKKAEDGITVITPRDDAWATTKATALDDYWPQVEYDEDNPRPAENPLAYARIKNMTISATGAITGTAEETGETILIGYLAIGSVTNPNGVSHIGDSYYSCGDGAGDLTISMLGGIGKDLGFEYVNGSLYENTGDNNAANGENTPTPSDKAAIGNAKGTLG